MSNLIEITILFAVLVILLVMSAIVSAIETSITGADFVKVETIADKGNKKAKKTLLFRDKQQKIISTMLFLNNTVNIVATTVTTILVTIYIKNIPLAIATAVLTIIVLIFCEITPKRIANNDSENILIFFTDFIKVCLAILFPIVVSLNIFSDGLAKLLGISLYEKEDYYTEDELKTLMDISHEQGIIKTEEKEIMENAMEFGDKTLYDIMIPNKNVSYININATYDEVINKFINNEYTRYPVVDDTLDNVVGILNIKDFIKLQKIGKENYNLRNIMREPFFLGEKVKIASAFRRMQKVYANIVIVRSDNCKTIGIVSLEDILEEIVGDIKDEFDNN